MNKEKYQLMFHGETYEAGFHLLRVVASVINKRFNAGMDVRDIYYPKGRDCEIVYHKNGYEVHINTPVWKLGCNARESDFFNAAVERAKDLCGRFGVSCNYIKQELLFVVTGGEETND